MRCSQRRDRHPGDGSRNGWKHDPTNARSAFDQLSMPSLKIATKLVGPKNYEDTDAAGARLNEKIEQACVAVGNN